MSRKTISKKSAAEAEAERRAAFEGEVPELDHAFFEGAQIRIGKRILRDANGTYMQRGRPPLGESAKVQQSLRLSREVLEHFRATGPGWQARIDEVLKRHVAEVTGAARCVAEEREAWRGEREEGEG